MDSRNEVRSREFDHSSNEEFLEYYARQSVSPSTIQRMTAIRDAVLRVLKKNGRSNDDLVVCDVGCGAGTLSRLWAQGGGEVHGLDVNGPLIELARKRAKDEGLDIEFLIGSATELPWPDETFDVCTVPELLEHVVDWEKCMIEFCRVLKPGGVLYLSTSNKLCPVQQEFTLPLYSWYPSLLKRYCEKLAVTTHPQLANFAKYPAVHWFTFFQLKRWLAKQGLEALDRFDIMDVSDKGVLVKISRSLIVSILPLRWLAHMATPYTVVLAVKDRQKIT